jgi:hypothetical protein
VTDKPAARRSSASSTIARRRIHNRRTTQRVSLSAEGDGGFAVVDEDTLTGTHDALSPQLAHDLAVNAIDTRVAVRPEDPGATGARPRSRAIAGNLQQPPPTAPSLQGLAATDPTARAIRRSAADDQPDSCGV